MKEAINKFYNITPLSFIKITDKVYLFKTDNKNYILKYIEKNSLDPVIEKLNILDIDCFLFPLLNNKNEYLSFDNNISFAIYEYLSEEKVELPDLKIKFFLHSLATLHNRTFYTLNVNSKFFLDTYNYLGERIDTIEDKIKKYMDSIIKLDYKSPSMWLFILNYPVYINAINYANESLEKFKELVVNKTSVRMAFTYSNFDYKHIFLKERKIIGIDNIELAPPIYDIFYSISNSYKENLDLEQYYISYFKTFILEQYEKEWLYTLLYIPKIEFSSSETTNLTNIIFSLDYLKNMQNIINSLKNLKPS